MKRRTFLTMAGSLVCYSVFTPGIAWAALKTAGKKSMSYNHWKTLCVGRYLIDIPEEAIVSFNPIFGDSTLSKTQGTVADAKKFAEEKVNELRGTKHQTKGNLYIRSIPLHSGGMLVQGWRVAFNANTTNAYLFIPVQTPAGPFVYSCTTKVRLIEEQQSLQDLVAFGSSFRAIPPGTIPKEPGFCFDDVIVLNVPESFKEKCSVGFDDSRVKGLVLGFETISVQSTFPWLTQIEGRSEESCRGIQEEAKCKQLRFGKHNVGSLLGEEICLAGKTSDGKYRTYLFEWNTPGHPKNKKQPNLTATLLYQGVPLAHPTAPIPFSSDEEALEVWDKFLSTIRIRPIG